ncbi:hypothetical protein D3C71_1817990 [compost metagenome]
MFTSGSADTDLYFNKPAFTTFATEPFCLSHSAIAESMFPPLINVWIFLTKFPTLPVPDALLITIKRSTEKTHTIKNKPSKTGTIAPAW